VNVRLGIALGAQLALFGSLNFFDNWTLELMPIKFVVAAILCGLAYLLAATEFAKGARKGLSILWLGAIALRFIALPLTPASDVWRYQADGALQRAGLNPYRTSPAEAEAVANLPDTAQVPRTTEATAYSPGAEFLFRAIPQTHFAFLCKLLFGMADLLTVVLLLRLVDARTAAWFAWNPLVAYSFFGAGHFDSVVLLCIAALLTCVTRRNQTTNIRGRWGYALGAAVALGIAISFRPVMLVLLLPTVFALGFQAIGLALAIAIPAAAGAAVGVRSISDWNFFGDFPQISRLNDLFWWIIEDTTWPNWHQQHYRYDVVIAVVCGIASLFFMRNWRRGFLWSLGLAIFLAPVLHAWYLTWILPIATWRRAFGWHFLSVTIFAYYLFFSERLFALPWRAEPWMRGMIILPVLFAAAMLIRQRYFQRETT